MADWLGRASQGREMYFHDLEVMGLNLGQVVLVCVVLLSKSYLN